jgi:hypothetical protein
MDKLVKNMKTFFQAFCFVLISLLVVTDSYAEAYQLSGEFYHDDGLNKATRSLRSRVVSGVPVIIKQGGQIVSLVFTIEPPPSNKYSLAVSLMTDPKSTDEISTTLIKNTYQSSLVGGQNGPLEFEIGKNGVKISGVIGLAPYRLNQRGHI